MTLGVDGFWGSLRYDYTNAWTAKTCALAGNGSNAEAVDEH